MILLVDPLFSGDEGTPKKYMKIIYIISSKQLAWLFPESPVNCLVLIILGVFKCYPTILGKSKAKVAGGLLTYLDTINKTCRIF